MARVYNRRRGSTPAPPDAVYVGRPTKWGKPFPLETDTPSARAACLEKYEAWLAGQPALLEAMRRELRGKDLVCWCAPKACHADVILRVANEDVLSPVKE